MNLMSILFMFIPMIFMLIIFGLFVIQAVWVALDSRKRHDEYWWLWSIAAIVAFPIGLIVYIIVSRNDKATCCSCNKEVPKTAKVCPYCGQKCGYFCPSCGQKTQIGWRYCANCSTELPENIVSNDIKKKNNKWVIIIVGIIIAVGLFFIGIIITSFYTFNYATSSYNEEQLSISKYDGYTGQNYEKSFTDTKVYTVPGNTHSFWYKGEQKRGVVVVRIYDDSNNLLIESEPITEEEFADVFLVKPGQRVEVEFSNYKGLFYTRFN